MTRVTNYNVTSDIFKVGGPIPWSRVLLLFYIKNRQVYPVWCPRLHNHTIFIKKLRKKLGGPSKFLGGPDPLPLRPPGGCAHGDIINTVKLTKPVLSMFKC